MIYILKTQNPDNLDGAIVTTLSGEDVDFKIVDTKSWAIFINIDGNEFRLFNYNILNSFQTGSYLKLDTNSTKIRQITSEKIKELQKTPVVRNDDQDNSFDFNLMLDINPTFLKDVHWDPNLFKPIMTGTFFDKFASTKGGLMPATNIMVTGDPGIGKSSNMIEVLTRAKGVNPNVKVAYVSAEMEPEDFAEFRQYYDGVDEIPILFLGDYLYSDDGYPIWQVIKSFLNPGYDLVVFDSLIEVQMIIQEELNLTQKKGEAWMLKLMRQHNKGFNESKSYTCFLCIQQKNKSGQYVGSKRLEHMTTSFLQLLWDPKEKGKRYMVFEKNRKGSVKARLYYDFAKEGGIEYDSKRYEQELQLLELCKMSGKDVDEIETMTLADFETMFKATKKDITD